MWEYFLEREAAKEKQHARANGSIIENIGMVGLAGVLQFER